MVFLPFSSVSLTELCSFWYFLKDLFTLHKLSVEIIISSFLFVRKYVDQYGPLRATQWRMG